MADKTPKLETFKIGDTQRPTVGRRGGTTAPKAAEETDQRSLGFARIERILENEDPASISKSLNTMLDSLTSMEAEAATPKDKAAAKKAMIAVERAADLMDYLFQTKSAMETQTITKG